MGVPSIGSPPARSWEFGESAGSWYHEGDHAGMEMTHAITRSKKGRRHEVDLATYGSERMCMPLLPLRATEITPR
jgi:hypothetical protein